MASEGSLSHGIPQNSVLNVIQFTIFFREIYEKIKSADDIFNVTRFQKHHPYSERSGHLYE